MRFFTALPILMVVTIIVSACAIPNPADLRLTKSSSGEPRLLSFVVLEGMQHEQPEAVELLPPALKVAMVIDQLNVAGVVDPFGDLRTTDGWASKVLVTHSSLAAPELIHLLYDKRPVTFTIYPGEIRARAEVCQYRRCDYAYRILCSIYKKPYTFTCDVAARDTQIHQMIANQD